MSGVNGYLRYLGLKINSDDYKHLVKTPKIRRTHDKPITKEMVVRLLHNSSPKLQAAIVMAVASGMRLGEMVSLRIADIDFSSTPTRIRLRAETTKTRESRETFLTAEATQILKDYLVRTFGWDEKDKNSHLQNSLIFSKTKQRGKKEQSKQMKFCTQNSPYNIRFKHMSKEYLILMEKTRMDVILSIFMAFASISEQPLEMFVDVTLQKH